MHNESLVRTEQIETAYLYYYRVNKVVHFLMSLLLWELQIVSKIILLIRN